MTTRRATGLGLVLFVTVVVLSIIPGQGRAWKDDHLEEYSAGGAQRVLLARYQSMAQCQWLPGEGCAANSRFAAYTLNRTKSDPVAQYAAASLSCVSITSKAECQSPTCVWDTTLGDGQQGCSLHPAKGMQLRQACMEPEFQDAFAQLQQCLAADRNCVCTRAGDPSSCTQPAGGSLCQSAAGCWLAALSGSTQDLLQLTNVQLSVVLPSLQTLWVDPSIPMPLLKASDVLGTTGRRRLQQQQQQQQRALLGVSHGRQLLDVPSLSNPFVDIEQQQQGGGKVVPESGRPSSGGAAGGGSFTSGLGQNIPISIEGTVPDTSTATVERDKSLSPAPGGGQITPESGQLPPQGQQTPAAPAPAPALRPEAGQASPAPAPAPSGTPTPAPVLPDMTPARANSRASPEFWKCVDDAAERADTTRKWADVDYNNKQLSLDTWLRVIQPVALVDWGVKVLECYKTQTSATMPPPNLDSPKSYEVATVALMRAFQGMHSAFNAFMQSAAPERPQFAQKGLADLLGDVLPTQIQELQDKYSQGPPFDDDVMLQAQALLLDVQWFLSTAQSIIAVQPDLGDVVFQGVIGYGVDTMQQLLRWLYADVYSGSAVYTPPATPPTPLSGAAAAIAQATGGVYLSAQGVAVYDPLPIQLQGMHATSLAWAATAAAKATTPLSARSGLVRNAVDGIARSHIVDFWTNRINMATPTAPAPARDAALTDTTEWRSLSAADRNQLQMLVALQQLVQAQQLSAGKVPAALGGNAGLMESILASTWRWLEAVSQNLNPGQSTVGSVSVVAQSLEAAGIVGQCYGSPVGIKVFANASAADEASACAKAKDLLNTLTQAASSSSKQVQDMLSASVKQQLQCSAVSTAACNGTEGCELALAWGDLGNTAASAAMQPPMVCQVAAQEVQPGKFLDNRTLADIGSSSSCDAFLQLPVCSTLTNADDCAAFSSCSWVAMADRATLRTAAPAMSAVPPSAGANGTCSNNWLGLFGMLSAEGQADVKQLADTCRALTDAGACRALSQVVLIDDGSEVSSQKQGVSAAVLVPAIVVPVVVLGAVAAAFIMYRQRRAADEEDDSSTDSATTPAGGKRRKGGKGGKGGKEGKKGGWKKKAAATRAEPGAQRPDLMRDSFTDYMRAAPAQFINGVALARAAMEAGPGGAAEMHGDLIDLREENSGALLLGSQQVAGGRALAHAPSGGWAYGGSDTRRASDSSGGLLPTAQRPYSMSSPSGTSGASMLTTSGSLGMPLGGSATSSAAPSADAARAEYGAAGGLARTSHSSMVSAASGLTGISRYAPSARGSSMTGSAFGRFPAGAGAAAVAAQGSGDFLSDAEDGMSVLSPTNSACHDSVCTFRHTRPAGPSSALAAAPPLATAGSMPPPPPPVAAVAAVVMGDGSQGASQLQLHSSYNSQELLLSQNSSAPLNPHANGL